jgi:hypothetical protein
MNNRLNHEKIIRIYIYIYIYIYISDTLNETSKIIFTMSHPDLNQLLQWDYLDYNESI